MKFRIWIALIALYISWGLTYLAIRFTVETIPPFLMAATRFLIAGGVLYVVRRAIGDPSPTKIEWRSAAIVALFLLVGGNGGLTWAEQYVVSGIAALLVGSAPLWMALIDALRPGGQKPNLLTWIGLLLGFGGIVLLIGPSNLTGDQQTINIVGVTVLLLVAISWAIGSLYNRDALLPASPLLGTGMEMLAGSAGLFILSLISGEWGRVDIAQISTRSLVGFAYLVVIGAWVGFVSYTWLLRVASTSLVSTYAYVNPLIAIFAGYFLAQESLTPRILVAALVIVGAVALITLARGAPRNTTAGTAVRTLEER
jgi:drug/metabolite transporter (DMT)-like permease